MTLEAMSTPEFFNETTTFDQIRAVARILASDHRDFDADHHEAQLFEHLAAFVKRRRNSEYIEEEYMEPVVTGQHHFVMRILLAQLDAIIATTATSLSSVDETWIRRKLVKHLAKALAAEGPL